MKLREVEFDDVDHVSLLTEAAGWGKASRAGWDRLWRENPALAGGRFARGWVLEESGRVVGYVCNVARLYRRAGLTLRAASAGSLVVLPEFRGLSLQLLVQYARQDGVDLLLNTTAAPNVSQICQFLKFDRISQPDYDVSFYWILRPRPFVASALRKKQFGVAASRWMSVTMAPAAWLYARWQHRLDRTEYDGLSLSIIHPDAIDADFDDLWERITSSGERLLAYRTSSFLRWHFAAPSSRRWPFLVIARRHGRLVGYVAVIRQDAHHLGLARARFGDVFVENDEPATTRALLATAIREAGQRGAAMIEFVGFPQKVRAATAALRPLVLRSQAWPFVYHARDPMLHRALGREDGWYASLFDGDGSL